MYISPVGNYEETRSSNNKNYIIRIGHTRFIQCSFLIDKKNNLLCTFYAQFCTLQ